MSKNKHNLQLFDISILSVIVKSNFIIIKKKRHKEFCFCDGPFHSIHPVQSPPSLLLSQQNDAIDVFFCQILLYINLDRK